MSDGSEGGSPRGTRRHRGGGRSVVVMIFGVVFVLYAGWQAYRVSEAMAQLSQGSGTILSWQSIRDDKGRPLHYALVRFRTAEGKEVTSRAQPGRAKPGESGVRTDLLYRTANPTDVALGRPNNVYTMPATFGGVGLLVLLYGLFGYWREKRAPD